MLDYNWAWLLYSIDMHSEEPLGSTNSHTNMTSLIKHPIHLGRNIILEAKPEIKD